SIGDLREKLERAMLRLNDPKCRNLRDPRGIFYFAEPMARNGNLAFVFPGEGSQYKNMMADLCLNFPEVRSFFDVADRAFANSGAKILPSEFIYPSPMWSEEEKALADKHLW